MPPLLLIRDSLGGVLDTAVSHALVRAVARGDLPPCFRLHRTDRVVAFGRADTLAPGYPQAVRSASAAGYQTVQRLAGGRAAVFHEGTLAFSWAVPTPDPRRDIQGRFEFVSASLVAALRRLGLDARVGEVPGEYCPGRYSINLYGKYKVVGVGQRLVRGAAHVGGVIVVQGADELRRVLDPVYRQLDLPWDPRVAGELCEADPGLTVDTVAEVVHTQLSTRFDVELASIPPEIVDEARELVPFHRPLG